MDDGSGEWFWFEGWKISNLWERVWNGGGSGELFLKGWFLGFCLINKMDGKRIFICIKMFVFVWLIIKIMLELG